MVILTSHIAAIRVTVSHTGLMLILTTDGKQPQTCPMMREIVSESVKGGLTSLKVPASSAPGLRNCPQHQTWLGFSRTGQISKVMIDHSTGSFSAISLLSSILSSGDRWS